MTVTDADLNIFITGVNHSCNLADDPNEENASDHTWAILRRERKLRANLSMEAPTVAARGSTVC